jgi:hypothetical protein
MDKEWSVCLKGEIYLTLQADTKEKAINKAFKLIKEVPDMYIKIRETICESLDIKDENEV